MLPCRLLRRVVLEVHIAGVLLDGFRWFTMIEHQGVESGHRSVVAVNVSHQCVLLPHTMTHKQDISRGCSSIAGVGV